MSFSIRTSKAISGKTEYTVYLGEQVAGTYDSKELAYTVKFAIETYLRGLLGHSDYIDFTNYEARAFIRSEKMPPNLHELSKQGINYHRKRYYITTPQFIETPFISLKLALEVQAQLQAGIDPSKLTSAGIRTISATLDKYGPQAEESKSAARIALETPDDDDFNPISALTDEDLKKASVKRRGRVPKTP